MIKQALYYREKLGLSIIPIIPGKKKPMVEWAKYQNELPSIDEVKAWWTTTPDANIGIVTGKLNNLVVIDFDKHKKEFSDEIALAYFPEGIETPTATTPSGGQHLYFKYPKRDYGNNQSLLPAIDFRANGGYIVAPPSVNGNGNRYVWIEGLKITDIELASLPEQYIGILESNLNSNFKGNKNVLDLLARNTSNSKLHAKNIKLFQEGRRDQDIFHLANHLVKGRMPEIEIYQHLEFIARNCIPPYPEKDIKIKIKSALARTVRQERNISEEIREFILSTTGHFLSTEVYNCLQLSTRNDKKTCSIALSRLVKDDIIERVGNKNGCFRLISNDAPDIDLHVQRQESLKIELPLSLHTYYKAMPKNIIVCAGTVDAGKTAFMLRAAIMNVFSGMKIRYQTSEMGVEELQSRLDLFEDVEINDWDMINFKEVSSNFQDYILPDDLNIIDYLEMTSNFYEVGGKIKAIFDKLKKGIAIIALQKDKDADYGRGGMFSAEKARLYIALTSKPPAGGVAKIVKCKNWRDLRTNPNGLQCDFKLRSGNEIRQITGWERPE